MNDNKKFSLTLGWLYPELMSIYGDRGNIICLSKRMMWRGIDCRIERVTFSTSEKTLAACDLILGGGAQDRQQELVVSDLLRKKGKTLRQSFDRGIPGLFVCGSPQLLGHYYTAGDGVKLKGLGIFNFVTKHPGYGVPRCIGNTVGEIDEDFRVKGLPWRNTIVGFENHGGRTYLGVGVKPFARVVKGYGNNGRNGDEGAIYRNVIACYYHGPLLPKNPHIADWLIIRALEVKYRHHIQLTPLDDALEWKAHESMVRKLGVEMK
jgi:lipid II isoglutaminyl synthase (glutamine-hydrolysing)